MEHDRWSWFAGGVVLGILVGLSMAAGYCFSEIAAVLAEEERKRTKLVINFDKAFYERSTQVLENSPSNRPPKSSL